ncbi:MAG: MarR family transcriptional regulator [Thermoplasmata archaeon]
MVIEIEQDTLEERVLRILLQSYPITVEDLKWELKISKDRLNRVLKKLTVRGIIELEKLPGTTYVRLLRTDLVFVGMKATQKKRFKRKGGKRREEDYEGIMFQ